MLFKCVCVCVCVTFTPFMQQKKRPLTPLLCVFLSNKNTGVSQMCVSDDMCAFKYYPPHGISQHSNTVHELMFFPLLCSLHFAKCTLKHYIVALRRLKNAHVQRKVSQLHFPSADSKLSTVYVARNTRDQKKNVHATTVPRGYAL